MFYIVHLMLNKYITVGNVPHQHDVRAVHVPLRVRAQSNLTSLLYSQSFFLKIRTKGSFTLTACVCDFVSYVLFAVSVDAKLGAVPTKTSVICVNVNVVANETLS